MIVLLRVWCCLVALALIVGYGYLSSQTPPECGLGLSPGAYVKACP